MMENNKLLGIARQVGNYAEQELGGTVTVSDNPEHGQVIFIWKKYREKDRQLFRYEQKIAYEALESVESIPRFGREVVNEFKKVSKKEMANDG